MGGMLSLSGLTMAYVTVAWLGLSVAIVPGGVSPVWPATGLAIAALTLWGPRLWPAIAIGAFIANFIIAGNPVLVAAGTAAGNTFEALIGAWALRHMGVRGEVSCIRDAATLLLVEMLAPLPSVTVGALSLTLGGLSPWDSYLWVCLVGWLGNTLGAFVVLPLVLAWAGQRVPAVYDSRPLEFAGAGVLIVTLTSLAFFFGRRLTEGGGAFPSAGSIPLSADRVGIAPLATSRRPFGNGGRLHIDNNLYVGPNRRSKHWPTLVPSVGALQCGRRLVASLRRYH